MMSVVSSASDSQVSKPAYVYMYICVYDIHMYVLIHIIYITTSSDVSGVECVCFTGFRAGMSTYIYVYMCVHIHMNMHICVYIFSYVRINPSTHLNLFPKFDILSLIPKEIPFHQTM